jgi:hypothetical protein
MLEYENESSDTFPIINSKELVNGPGAEPAGQAHSFVGRVALPEG